MLNKTELIINSERNKHLIMRAQMKGTVFLGLKRTLAYGDRSLAFH